jgi:methylated-DNA-[protein]-cysteine S-methyltransferase
MGARVEGPFWCSMVYSSSLDSAQAMVEGETPMVDQVLLTAFRRRVYETCSQIPLGSFSTYGEMAKHLHSSPRAVGGALRCNPFAPKVPCHRVIRSDYYIGGFSGKVEVDGRKRALLREEGVTFDGDGFLEASCRGSLFKEFK